MIDAWDASVVERPRHDAKRTPSGELIERGRLHRGIP